MNWRRWIRPLRAASLGWLLAVAALAAGGCTAARPTAGTRPFVFAQDTFAHSNELHWVYQVDPATGETRPESRQPKPSYALHCFVMARAAREFFWHARFDPAQPAPDSNTCRRLIRAVTARSARHGCAEEERIVIPGYASLREFSAAHEALLKEECGTIWGSYFQRGNWRMVFPFTRGQQAGVARQLAESLRLHRPPIVHITDFPRLGINHALLLIAVEEDPDEMRFEVYDPNRPAAPVTLRFDRVKRQFVFPATHYYAGGEVKIYEVYRGWCY